MRDLGQMGEDTFKLWCSGAGLTANKSQIDRYGWDYFVEFQDKDKISPENLHKSPIECKVQVKATDKKSKQWQIKLSNLKRLSTAQIPAFFIFLEFDGKDTAQRAYLVHVDEEIITKTLKKTFELEQSGKKTSNPTITIKYSEENKIEPSDGQGLKKSIERYVGSDPAEYISHKKRHLESTGLEQGVAQVTFTTKGEESTDALIDSLIGIKKKINVEKFTGHKKRFGIISKQPFIESTSGTIELGNTTPSDVGKFGFKESKKSPYIYFDCRIYTLPISLNIPDGSRKFRIETDIFDIIISTNGRKSKLNLAPPYEQKVNLKKLHNSFKFLYAAGFSQKKIPIKIQGETLPELSLSINGGSGTPNFIREISALEGAEQVLSYFKDNNEIFVSLDEIQSNSHNIISLSQIIKGNFNDMHINFTTNQTPDTSKKSIFIVPAGAQIGNNIYIVIFASSGKIRHLNDDRYESVKIKSLNIIDKIAMDADDPELVECICEAMTTASKRYDQAKNIFLLDTNELEADVLHKLLHEFDSNK